MVVEQRQIQCRDLEISLTGVDNNKRARHLYESLGFTECGRIPNANRYDDGAYSDDILMVLQL